MKLLKLWLTPHGRIGRRTFVIGLAPIMAVLFVLSFVPLYGDLLGLGLVGYSYGCVFAKRLHDIGRSGWFQLLFWVGEGLLAYHSVQVTYVTLTQGRRAGEAMDAALYGTPQAIVPMLAGLTIFTLFITTLVFTPSRRGPNRYGAPAEPGPEDVF